MATETTEHFVLTWYMDDLWCNDCMRWYRLGDMGCDKHNHDKYPKHKMVSAWIEPANWILN